MKLNSKPTQAPSKKTICFDTVCSGFSPVLDGSNRPVQFETEREAQAEIDSDPEFYEDCFITDLHKVGHRTIFRESASESGFPDKTLQETYDSCSTKLTELFLALDDDIALEKATDALDEKFLSDQCTHESLEAVTNFWMNYHPEEL